MGGAIPQMGGRAPPQVPGGGGAVPAAGGGGAAAARWGRGAAPAGTLFVLVELPLELVEVRHGGGGPGSSPGPAPGSRFPVRPRPRPRSRLRPRAGRGGTVPPLGNARPLPAPRSAASGRRSGLLGRRSALSGSARPVPATLGSFRQRSALSGDVRLSSLASFRKSSALLRLLPPGCYATSGGNFTDFRPSLRASATGSGKEQPRPAAPAGSRRLRPSR